MNKPEFDYTPQGTIVRQAKRIRELEDARIFWCLCFIGMTAFCIVIAALKCQH